MSFYLACHVVESCFWCILSKIMIKFASSVMGKPFLAILESLKLKCFPGASVPTIVGPPTSLTSHGSVLNRSCYFNISLLFLRIFYDFLKDYPF